MVVGGVTVWSSVSMFLKGQFGTKGWARLGQENYLLSTWRMADTMSGLPRPFNIFYIALMTHVSFSPQLLSIPYRFHVFSCHPLRIPYIHLPEPPASSSLPIIREKKNEERSLILTCL